MMTVKDVALDSGRYGEGFGCSVTFQVGDYSYSTVKVELPPHATRAVVEHAITEAKLLLAADTGDITIKGEPRTIPLIKEPASESAEVEEPAPRAMLTRVDGEVL